MDLQPPTSNQCQRNKELEVPTCFPTPTPPLLAEVMDQVLEDQTPDQITALRGSEPHHDHLVEHPNHRGEAKPLEIVNVFKEISFKAGFGCGKHLKA